MSAGDEPVGAIEGCGAFLGVVVERIDHRGEGRNERGRILARVLGLRPRVVRVEQQPLVEALVHLQDQCVVGRVDDVGHFNGIVDIRVGSSSAPVERKHPFALAVDDELDLRVCRAQVRVQERGQVRTTAVEIRRRDRDVAANGPIDRQFRHVDLWTLERRREILNRRLDCRRRRRREHGGVLRCAGGRRRVREGVRPERDAVVGQRARDDAVARTPVVHAPSAADDRRVRAHDVVGETHARSEVVLILVEGNGCGVCRVAGELDAVRLGLAGLREFLVLPANAQVQRQLVVEAPVVLDEPVVVGRRELDVAGKSAAAQVELLVIARVVALIARRS